MITYLAEADQIQIIDSALLTFPEREIVAKVHLWWVIWL